jgi:hypothetical protein
VLSARFLLSNMIVLGLATDSFTTTTAGCQRDLSSTTFQTGAMMDGLSVLADVTGDAEWRDAYVLRPSTRAI